jgi:hypothetical protein
VGTGICATLIGERKDPSYKPRSRRLDTEAVVGLPPGPHKVLIELVYSTHKAISSQTVSFMVPDPKSRIGQ